MKENYDPHNYFVKIDFEPKWAFIGSIRGFIENFIFTCIKNQVLGKAVALCASELLENAVKYSTTEKISLDIKFERPEGDAQTSVTLHVYNYTSKENVTALRKLLADINQSQPKEAYMSRMQQVLMQDKSNPASRLGLARIRYESNAKLSMEVTDDHLVTLVALIEETDK